MDKANLIISIIIVLCIATAVAAYGIINNDNPIFSELPNMGSDDGGSGNGVGNNTTHGNSTSSGSSSSSSGSASSSSSSSGSASSSSSSSGSASSSSGSSSRSGSGSGSGSGGGGSSQQTSHSSAQIRAIANSAILEEGCYAGTPQYSNGYWYVAVYDASGNVVDSLAINDRTGAVGRG